MQVADLFASLGLKVNEAQWSRGTKAIEGIATGLRRMVELALVFEGVRWFGDQIKDTVELGSHINDLSQSAGVTTDTLQELGYAAKLNSSDMDSMAAGLGKLSRNMLAAKNGGEEQQKAFAAMGVTAVDASGNLRPVGDVFEDITEHLGKMPDGTEKTARAMTVLGKSGASLIPTMNDLAQRGFGTVRQEARDMGAVIDGQAISALDDFGDTTDKLKMGLTGLRNAAVIALLPPLKRLADAFVKWFKANRVEIVKKLQAAAEALGRVFTWLADIFGRVTGVIGDVITALEDALPGIDLFKSVMVAAGIAMAVAWIAALGPIALIGIALAAVVLVAQDLWSSIEHGDGVFADLWESIKAQLDEGDVAAITQGFYQWKEAATVLFDVFQDEGERVVWVLGKVKDAVMWVVDHASDLEGLLGPLAKLVPDGLLNTVMPVSGLASHQDAQDEAGDREDAKRWDPSKIPGVVSPLTSLTSPFSNSLNGGASSVTAPLSVNLTINSAGAQAGDIVDAFRTSFGTLLDEHVRNIQTAVQGAKR